MEAVTHPSAGTAHDKWEMIQEPFLAMQGDPWRFRSLRGNPQLSPRLSEGLDRGPMHHEKRGEIGLLK